MKKNVGTIDRVFRGLAAVLVLILFLTKTIQGGTAVILGLMAIAFVFTSTTRFCPCYTRFNINTSKEKSEK